MKGECFSPKLFYRWGSPFSFERCPPLSRWWCPALRMSVFTCLPNHSCISLAGGAPLFGCFSSLVSQSDWWCAALWMFVFSCLVVHICLPGGVRLFGFPSSLVSLHLSPTLSSGCHLCAFTCLSSCVSGHVSPNLSVSQLICLQS